MASLLFDMLQEASYGAVRIDIMDLDQTEPRSWARYQFPHVDSTQYDDRGGNPRITNCRLIFFPHRPGDNEHTQRFADFRALKDKGDPQTFIHPIEGEYEAIVSEFSYQVGPEPRDTIFVSCTFEEVGDKSRAVFQADAGTPLDSGEEQVAADASAYDKIAAGLGVVSSIAKDALATVKAWGSEARRVNVELVRISNAIDLETRRLELATNIKRYALYRSLLRLHSNVAKAARVTKQKTPRIIEILVNSPLPLIVIAARTYGASQAGDRAKDLQVLNVIKNPARVEKGTILKAEAPSAPRERLRSAS